MRRTLLVSVLAIAVGAAVVAASAHRGWFQSAPISRGAAAPANRGSDPTAMVRRGRPRFSPLHVSGTKLLNASGQGVFLHGVNRAGSEYSCIHNTGFFDGTGTSFTQEDAQIRSMAKWGINSELIGLNEDCWLGINGVRRAYSNSSASPPTPGCSARRCPYANAIENLVKTDEANHIYPVISLMFLAPGTKPADGTQIGLADDDHAPLFWGEVANFFKNDPYVIFRLEEEPTLDYGSESDWQCWSQGDVSYSRSSVRTTPTSPTPTGSPGMCETSGLTSYKTVGMQSLVNIVRGTGAANIVALPGLGYSNMVACGPTTAPSSCGMLASSTPPVTDPRSPGQLIASVDVYPDGNTCGEQLNTSCYDATYKPVGQVMPLIAGETGENPNGIYTPTTYVDMFMRWMDGNGNGYFPYAWDPWAGLIANYTDDKTPSTIWGTDYYDHINNLTPPRPAQPTRGITFVHSLTEPCNVRPRNGTIRLGDASHPIDAGDDLFAVFAGQGYIGTAPTVDSVSDNVNGGWRRLAWTGSRANGDFNLGYSVFESLDSRAARSGLTLTINGTPNDGGNPSAVVFQMRGVSSVAHSSFQSRVQAASNPFTGPTLSKVPAHDVVLGLWGAYSGSTAQNLSVSPPWNIHSSYWTAGSNCTAAGMDWMQPKRTGNVTARINMLAYEYYYGGTIDLHP